MTDIQTQLPPTVVVAGPRLPRRETWVNLPGDYSGFRYKVWVNAPKRLWNAVFAAAATAEDEVLPDDTPAEVQTKADRLKARADAASQALQQIVLEHNGWLDDLGAPFSPASEPAFWDEIPNELAGLILATAALEMTRFPNSLAPKKRR
jgi:hypothetical protein